MTRSPSAIAFPPAFRWHPKLTPYRLSFIVVTSGLGITKAVLVSYGQVTSSITVEWITGVAVALSFQFLGEYEYKLHHSACIEWIFSYDCLNILKMLLSPNGENRPVSIQSSHPENTHSTSDLPPIVTVYRLLVSTTVSALGITKMLCAYLGLSAAMNTFDWIVAVPLTLGLYYVGLYEERERQLGAPRMLFDIEYSSKARPWLYFAGTVAISLCWLSGWLVILRGTVVLFSGPVPHMQGSWETRFESALQWMIISFSLAMVEVGAFGLGFAVWPIIETWTGRYTILIRGYAVRAASITLYFSATMFWMALAALFFCSGIQFFTPADRPLRIPDVISGSIMISWTAAPVGFAFATIMVAVGG